MNRVAVEFSVLSLFALSLFLLCASVPLWLALLLALLLPVPAFAAGLLFEANALDDQAAVGCLAHVVHRQGCHANRSESLHFNTGAAENFGRRLNSQAVGLEKCEIERDGSERKGVAEGDEIGGLFRGHDPGESGDFEDIALGEFAIADECERNGLHPNNC